ncbi:MAG: protein-L-isoaspartate O-methyltransferase [Gemmatimonadales bacterium]|nr:protein-L-isoaspartate O-methyltransferase [Gemmatimonadales bacterium]NIN11168.1 protein-L-isoaspartate O-methyltransferase [Gemmatimonadales bacterium]NIN49767.1 protein-L-isoaspartate O-methyltransferase [Gemmatimonadales bacterium]NIP07231.1 protein-L-isoaspartate O-methyltransferase [Gemmatimonadales bacterium]NIR00444.1 protein-L-isoaspartate O-methyltransferase [Gemmatimonadales bacterium]
MLGWIVPPPREPTKTKEEFACERAAKVDELAASGYLKSERIRQALLKVGREEFIPRLYRDYSYLEVPLPLPGARATISCPHSYPLFYEPLGLEAGQKFLEVGLGSGYGAAVAREVVGKEGLVVAMEIDPVTFQFAKANLEETGYHDVVLVNADGTLGYPPLQPYDRISITAACNAIPPPLLDQLPLGGRVIAPVFAGNTQMLVLMERTETGMRSSEICPVLYVSLQGKYGV